MIEWVIHVFILHWRPRRLGPVQVDSLLARKHREHHADPRDIPLVFIPWQALVWLLPAYVAVALLVMPTLPSALSLLVSVYGIKFGYEWTHYLVHSDYRPQSRVVPRGVAQPPAAPLQERALLVHRHLRRHRRPAVRHLPRPGHGQDLPDGQEAARDRGVRGRGQAEDRRLVTVHHLNCATMRPVGAFGGRVSVERMVAHCLLVERADGLLLVDTGFGTDDIADPSRLGPAVPWRRCARRSTRPRPRGPRSRRSATGSRTSPTSRSPTSTSTTPAASPTSRGRGSTCSATSSTRRSPPRWREKARYVGAQWAHGPRWQRHEVAGEEWLGFRAVTALDDDVLLVPLRGHTRGHCGVAVRRPGGGWLLHAGDSYFHTGDLEPSVATPPGLRAFQRLMAVDDLAAPAQPGAAA